MSKLEDELAFQLTASGIEFEREYKFARDAVGNPDKGIRAILKGAHLKDWRFDFILIKYNIAIEVEGGTWTGGRHVTGAGFEGDCLKYNQALILGWNVLRFTGKTIKNGDALQQIMRLIERFEYESGARMADHDATSGAQASQQSEGHRGCCDS